MSVFKVILPFALAALTAAIDFQSSSSDGVRWALRCDWRANDVAFERSRGEDCGRKCRDRPGCSHFTWTDWEGGTCFMKQGNVCEGDAIEKWNENAVCGHLPDRNSCGGVVGDWQNNVKGTRWADQSDAGGCQVPQGNYRVTDAIALGQQSALGPLRWKQGLCGKVLTVRCSSGVEFDAVVASTCDLGSDNCGVDMITKTWNKATNSATPGIATCSVRLSATNPLNDQAPVCYYRPNSETNNMYFAALGVLNTGSRIVESATLAGQTGNRGNDNWFLFFSGGQPLFSKEATVDFRYEGGGGVSFRLSECKTSGGVQIFS